MHSKTCARDPCGELAPVAGASPVGSAASRPSWRPLTAAATSSAFIGRRAPAAASTARPPAAGRCFLQHAVDRSVLVRPDHEQIDRLPVLAHRRRHHRAGVSVNAAERGNAPASLLNDFRALPGDVCRIARVGKRPDRFECGKLGAVISGGDRRSAARVSGERPHPPRRAVAARRLFPYGRSKRSDRGCRVGSVVGCGMLVLRCGRQSVHPGRVSRHHAFRVTASQWRAIVVWRAAKWGSPPVTQSSKSRDDGSPRAPSCSLRAGSTLTRSIPCPTMTSSLMRSTLRLSATPESLTRRR